MSDASDPVATDCRIDGAAPHDTERKWCRRLTYALRDDHPELARRDVQRALGAAFGIWQRHPDTDVVFREVPRDAPADLEICWERFDEGSSLHAEAEFPPENCDAGPGAGRIRFNLRRRWTLRERDDGEEPIDFVTLAAHEIGHAIGIEHCMACEALMNPTYGGSHRALAAYDVGFYRYLYYGDERPPT